MIPQNIDASILRILNNTLSVWSQLDSKNRTAFDEQALLFLTAAGFVERRVSLRMRLAGVKDAIEATIVVTGEYGLVEAMEGVISEAWHAWGEVFKAQRTNTDGPPPSLIAERIQDEEIRLTPDGVQAVTDVEGGQSERVLDYVKKTGCFGPESRLVLSPTSGFLSGIGRPPVKRNYGDVHEIL